MVVVNWVSVPPQDADDFNYCRVAEDYPQDVRSSLNPNFSDFSLEGHWTAAWTKQVIHPDGQSKYNSPTDLRAGAIYEEPTGA